MRAKKIIKIKPKIAYITYVNIPSKHAHSIHIMEMCSSLSEYSDLELIVPFFALHNVSAHNIYEYYSIERTFKIKRIYIPDFLFFSRYVPQLASLFFHIHAFMFSITSILYVLINKEKYHFIYTRSIHVAYILSFLKPVIYETHTFSRSPLYHILEKKIIKRVKLIVFLTPYLSHIYKSVYNIKTPYIILHDAVNINKISEIKERHLDIKRPRIGYIGSVETLGSKKGIEVILDAAKEIKNAVFYIIGFKNDEEFKKYESLVNRKKLNNVVLMKRVPHKEAISYLKSFDIALLPLPRTTFNAYFTSPMKLFEYMAAKKCIIASDLPSIRSIVSDEEVIFFEPGNPKDLAKKIKYALSHPKECKKKAEKAYKKVVKEYTWNNRARKVLEVI